jgi:hypothetical protein
VDVLKVKVEDIFEISGGRTLWLPIKVKTGDVQSTMFIEIDMQPTTSLFSVGYEVSSYEDELNIVTEHHLPIMDPIYHGVIELPDLNP